MPACFVRQTYIVITMLTSLHANIIKSGRHRLPPGFAAAVVHNTPHQLFARLVSQSCKRKAYRQEEEGQHDVLPASACLCGILLPPLYSVLTSSPALLEVVHLRLEYNMFTSLLYSAC